MKNEDKQLLLTDLCGRLPYGVIVHGVFINYNKEIDKIQYEWCDTEFKYEYLSRFETVKPYLRPIESMDSDEYEEWQVMMRKSIEERTPYAVGGISANQLFIGTCKSCADCIEWLNKYHFDFRGLIEKGVWHYQHLKICITLNNI